WVGAGAASECQFVMRRRFFNLAASTLCVLIALAIFIAWGRSYLGETLLLESYDGKLLLSGIDTRPEDVHTVRDATTARGLVRSLVTVSPSTTRQHSLLGFYFVHDAYG